MKVEILRAYGGNQKSIGPLGKAKRKAFHFTAAHWFECVSPADISSLANSSHFLSYNLLIVVHMIGSKSFVEMIYTLIRGSPFGFSAYFRRRNVN